ncbi:DUF2911 domain-containing protein [Salegentibacter chungangensis]|uniref:DUF2911 domain-containing protein n=1 Tax=Salegentibacter chungangensis TaxID=1335724 RepID=A0ABW3NVE4_9FLAO
MKKFLLGLCFVVAGFTVNAQVQAPQPSPYAKVEQKVGLTDVSLEYSRPGMKDRQIFGGLVPYNEMWRTGANANTKISFSDDVIINGETLSKGTYALFTIPKKDSWDVIFYKDSNNWGTPQEWEESKVALKTQAEVTELPWEMETFTIMIDDLTNNSAALNFLWEKTMASLTFEVPTDAKTMASIEKVMNGPTAGDYFASAVYFHDTEKDLEQAYEWIKKAVDMADPNAYWMLRRKSLIEAELGKKEEAIKTAKKSLAAAEKAGDKTYVKMNKESLEEWGAE